MDKPNRTETTTPSRHRWTYTAPREFWDEAVRPSGLPRRPWRNLAVALQRLTADELTRRWQAGQHLIQSHGITYNVYGDSRGMERPWSLDPIPLLIDSGEWAYIERAMVQRATLLNLILADLYGPRKLIYNRDFPPALLFANPNFLRPCHGIEPFGGVFLHYFAADIARSPDGRWWVISDRSQAPSGIGYALENRLVSARTLPSVFDQCHVRPLHRFLEKMRDALLALAPTRRHNPRVVLLTPGPANETYFEQSFLARHWGFPLVEGADLTVRDNRVFLKTLAGLDPVDVVMRRLDDAFCDPLELRGDSLLGVPGLTQAVRSRNVAVANALGSGLMETSGHMAFLPGLSRRLLDQELRMPSVATWWCGDDEPRQFVLDHLEELVVKPAFPMPGSQTRFPGSMSSAARQDLRRCIQADPEKYVAQEQVALSTLPVRTPEGLTPRHMVMRVFAAWDGQSYAVMPGGLTRISGDVNSLIVSMQLGGGSKDTWVVGSVGDEEPASALPRHTPAAPAPLPLPSRLADHFFWLGRYSERVESSVRLVRALLPGLSAEEDFGKSASLESSIGLLAGLGYLPRDFTSASLAQQRFRVGEILSAMMYDLSRSASIGWNLQNVRRVAWPLKERLSQDTWRVLQQLDSEFAAAPPVRGELRAMSQIALLDRMIVLLSAFSGLLGENTTRTDGWRFVKIGRRLESCWQMADLLLAALVHGAAEIEPAATTLLDIADSSITYRARYFTEIRTEYVLQTLLADESNPRAIGFQLRSLVEHLRGLPVCQPDDGETPAALRLGEKMLEGLRGAGVGELAQRDSQGNLAALETFLRRKEGHLYDFSELLSAQYFSHLAFSRLPQAL